MSLLDTLENFCYKSHQIPKGMTLLKQGRRTTETYVLISGNLKVTTGNVHIGNFIKPGETFGEMACLLEEPASADVIAEEDSQVYIIRDLKAFLMKNPDQAVEMLLASYKRLKQMNKGVNFMLKLIP